MLTMSATFVHSFDNPIFTSWFFVGQKLRFYYKRRIKLFRSAYPLIFRKKLFGRGGGGGEIKKQEAFQESHLWPFERRTRMRQRNQ